MEESNLENESAESKTKEKPKRTKKVQYETLEIVRSKAIKKENPTCFGNKSKENKKVCGFCPFAIGFNGLETCNFKKGK